MLGRPRCRRAAGAEGVTGGKGCPLVPGNGCPSAGRCPGGSGLPGAVESPPDLWFWIAIAFCATEGGSAGANEAAGAGALIGPPFAAAAGGAGGAMVVVLPAGLVMVTVLVILLMTTVLWILL